MYGSYKKLVCFDPKETKKGTAELPGLALTCSTVFNSTKEVQRDPDFPKSQSFEAPILQTKSPFPCLSPTVLVILTPISRTT